MFGYVKPKQGELLVKEYEFYRAVYCGVCRSTKAQLGSMANILHSYDSVFLALVRMLFIPEEQIGAAPQRCIAHPAKKKPMLNRNDATDYTARAFAILTYYKLRDDLSDESLGRRMVTNLLTPIFASAKNKAALENIAEICRDRLERITALEKSGCVSVDEPASLFGELLGAIFSEGLSGSDAKITYQCGYHLGKFIYAADAAEDYESDRKEGKYNPYVLQYNGAELTYENRQTIKCALLLECKNIELAVNLLPYGNKHTIENIIYNIIYLGLPKRIEFLDKKDSAEDTKGDINETVTE